MKEISNTHLKKHNLTKHKYAEIDNNFKEFMKIKMSNVCKKRKQVWNKDKTYIELLGVEEANRRNKLRSETCKISCKGRIMPINWKEICRKSKEKLYKERPEVKEKISKSRAKQITPIKDTTIEVKIQNFLKQLNIEYFTHQYMNIEHSYQCDILIPSLNLVIECDGDYWHKYPIGREIDKIRTSELIEKGFKVLRLWENEIRAMNLNNFVLCLKGVELK